MSNKRTAERWSRRLRVKFWRKTRPDETFVGYTSNFSNSGTFITTRTPVGPNARVKIEIGEGPHAILLEGLVARAQAVPAELQKIRDSGMGVRFLTVEEVLKELRSGHIEPASAAKRDRKGASSGTSVTEGPKLSPSAISPATAAASAVSSPQPPANDPTPAASNTEQASTVSPKLPPDKASEEKTEPLDATSLPIYPVRFVSFDQFQQLYDRDIRIGGMFISTPQPAAVNDEVGVRLELPHQEQPVELRARVISVTSPEAGGPGGMALELVKASDALSRLERYARGEGL